MSRFLGLAAAVGVLCSLIATSASASRLIVIPEGDTLTTGGFQLQYASKFDSNDGKMLLANVGISRVEMEAARFQNFQDGTIDAFGAQLSILPDTSFTPAVAVGVRDIGNRTDGIGAPYDGEAFYLALSKGIPVTGGIPLLLQDVKLHGGVGTGSLSGVFFGAEGTLPFGLRLAGEFDSKNVNFSASYSIIPSLSSEVALIKGDLYYGGKFSLKL